VRRFPGRLDKPSVGFGVDLADFTHLPALDAPPAFSWGGLAAGIGGALGDPGQGLANRRSTGTAQSSTWQYRDHTVKSHVSQG
jgi:hypothetical protein